MLKIPEDVLNLTVYVADLVMAYLYIFTGT